LEGQINYMDTDGEKWPKIVRTREVQNLEFLIYVGSIGVVTEGSWYDFARLPVL